MKEWVVKVKCSRCGMENPHTLDEYFKIFGKADGDFVAVSEIWHRHEKTAYLCDVRFGGEIE